MQPRVIATTLMLIAIAVGLQAQITPEHVYVFVDAANPQAGSGTLSDPYSTIGAAMASAMPHDYVVVRPGVYHEVVSIPYWVFLQSSGGAAETTIDATGLTTEAAVTLDALSQLEGFTIQNGTGSGVMASMGTAAFSGFGRAIRQNRIVGCLHAGITLQGALHPAISENLIVSCGGAGLALLDSASPLFSSNTITGCGVGISQTGTEPDAVCFLANSIIWGNTLDVQGSGTARLASSTVGDAALAATNNNQSDDPLFEASASGDFRLRGFSPALDGADPTYMLPSSVYDQRGFGHWRVMDGNGDGLGVADQGAFERGGLMARQTGTGNGSSIQLEIDTGPGTEWFLALGAVGSIPAAVVPLPSGPGSSMFLEVGSFVVADTALQGPSGVTTRTFSVLDPSAIGLDFPLQAFWVNWAASPVTAGFTSLEILRIR